jgi:hypothetical protein
MIYGIAEATSFPHDTVLSMSLLECSKNIYCLFGMNQSWMVQEKIHLPPYFFTVVHVPFRYSMLLSMHMTYSKIFLNDSRSADLSFKKKKKQFYITSRSKHHHNTYNVHKQSTQQNTTPPQPERGVLSKPPRIVLSSPTLCHAKSRGPLQV